MRGKPGLLFVVSAALAAAADPVFERRIAPLFAAQCAECHSEKTRTSGFSVGNLQSVLEGGNKHGAAVVAGHPERSPLVKLLKGQLAPQMPLGKTLAATDLALIEGWIRDLRAPTPAPNEWSWPFRKPVQHEPPAVIDKQWVRNPIDAFVLAKLEQHGLGPAEPASKRTLARRVFLDLAGMPPTPDEMQAFLADPSPDAYEKLIDRLLADPRYGERWGRHWLDLVRYAETSGLEGDGAIGNAWRYRDWVIQAFNANLPYDRFVMLQIAGGDEHSKTRNNYQPDPQGVIPTGFLRLAPWDRSNLVAAEVRANYLAEVTGATASIFLGLTAGCARCHDHKYDPISTRDFYRLQAFFNATQADRAVEVPYKEKGFAAKALAKVKEYEERLKNGPEKRALEELEQQLLKKLIAGRAERARGRELGKEDLRLELRLQPKRIFSVAEQERHADFLADAQRTQDPDENQALEAFEKQLLKKLAAAYARPDIDPLARFQALTAEQVHRTFARYCKDESKITVIVRPAPGAKDAPTAEETME